MLVCAFAKMPLADRLSRALVADDCSMCSWRPGFDVRAARSHRLGPDEDRLDSIMQLLLTVSSCWAKTCRLPAKWVHQRTAREHAKHEE